MTKDEDLGVDSIDVGTFLHRRNQYLPAHLCRRDGVDFGVAQMHYESQDTWSTGSSCLDWRAEIHLASLDAHGHAPSVMTGFVDFLVLRLGEDPVAEVLELYGDKAAAFTELFEGAWLAPDLDESDAFAGGMPIGTALLILDAQLAGPVLPFGRLRPWAVSEVAHTMLPTTAGIVAMQAISGTAPRRRLVSAELIDRGRASVGCIPVPGHSSFFGQATAYTYLDDARAGAGRHSRGNVQHSRRASIEHELIAVEAVSLKCVR